MKLFIITVFIGDFFDVMDVGGEPAQYHYKSKFQPPPFIVTRVGLCGYAWLIHPAKRPEEKKRVMF